MFYTSGAQHNTLRLSRDQHDMIQHNVNVVTLRSAPCNTQNSRLGSSAAKGVIDSSLAEYLVRPADMSGGATEREVTHAEKRRGEGE